MAWLAIRRNLFGAALRRFVGLTTAELWPAAWAADGVDSDFEEQRFNHRR